MYETLIFIAVVLLTQFIKAFVYPRFGKTGVHMLTFVIALVGLGIYQWAQADPSVMEWLVRAGQFLVGTIALYEVILSRIGFSDTKSIVEKLQVGRSNTY